MVGRKILFLYHSLVVLSCFITMIYRWWGNRNSSLVPGSPIALRATGAYRALCTSFAGRQIDSGKPNFCSGSFTLQPANTSAITKIPMYLSTFTFQLSPFNFHLSTIPLSTHVRFLLSNPALRSHLLRHCLPLPPIRLPAPRSSRSPSFLPVGHRGKRVPSPSLCLPP